MTYIKGRGAQIDPSNPFDNRVSDQGLKWHDDHEIQSKRRTQYLKTKAKSIINRVESPDIGMEYSMNPYQGCEHGCIYCYARNTHTYWGYSAGIEFEQKILVKEEAPVLLKKKLQAKNWVPHPIMFSGNTDCYQPAEKKFQLTRKMLEILWRFRHPTGIITKNDLILRDLDLLQKMASENLIKVAISITTLSEELRRKLEPRTATGIKRLEAVQKLSQAGVPVNVMFAPIIPSINDQELFEIAQKAADMGALSFNYTMVRLNGDVEILFKDWLKKNFPDRYKRVIHQIESCHGGTVNDSRFGTRMSGEGNFADIIRKQVHLARHKFFKDREMPAYNTSLYQTAKTGQLSLF